MKEEEIKKISIYEKINLITSELGVIEKKLNVDITKTRSFKAVGERQILDAIKPLEKKYRVASYPMTRQIVDKDVIEKENDYGVTKSMFMRIETIYRFINIDKPEEYIETTVYGDGIDTSDKAPGKAMTYADKYALMKIYKISTGDDEGKPKTPKVTAKKPTEEELKKRSELIVKFEKLVYATNTDRELIYSTYKVENNTQLSDKQLEQAIRQMEKKPIVNETKKEEVF